MGEVLGALREVFRSPGLRRLQLAWFTTSVGVWGGSLALAVYAYDTGGPVAVGAMALFRTLPGALAAPFLALEADRRSRRTILLLASVGLAACTLAIASAVALEAPLAVVYALVGLLAMVSPAYKPAQTALLPRLARTPTELSAANVAASMVFNLGVVVGALSAGGLLSATSAATSLGVLAGAFALAMAPLARIPQDPPPEPEPGARPASELVEGFRTVVRSAELRDLAAMACCLTLVDGALDVLVVVAALGFLDVGDAGVGLLSAVWGVGCVAGGPAVLRLLHRGRLTAGLTIGSFLLGSSVAVLGLLPAVAVAAASLVAFGIGYTLVEGAAETLLQRLVADHVLARVFGVVETLSVITVAVGSLSAGLLVNLTGARTTIVLTGTLMPAVVLLLRRRLLRLEAGTPVSDRDYALLRAHPIFAPLPVATIERLAGAVEEVHPADGAAVMSGPWDAPFGPKRSDHRTTPHAGHHRGLRGPGPSSTRCTPTASSPCPWAAEARVPSPERPQGRDRGRNAVTGGLGARPRFHPRSWATQGGIGWHRADAARTKPQVRGTFRVLGGRLRIDF